MTQQEEDKLREDFKREQCEQEDDNEHYSVYENNAELIEDWWIAKIKEREESLVERIRRIFEMADEREDRVEVEDIINLINKENEL